MQSVFKVTVGIGSRGECFFLREDKEKREKFLMITIMTTRR